MRFFVGLNYNLLIHPALYFFVNLIKMICYGIGLFKDQR